MESLTYNHKLYQISKLASSVSLGLTLFAFFLLTLPTTSAESGAVDDIAITVPLTCTLGIEGADSHNVNMVNGQYQANIGLSTITAYCNDPQGYAIYAMGTTSGEDNTAMVSTLGTTIGTGLINPGESSTSSSWGMKVATAGTEDIPTLTTSALTTNTDGYFAIPSDYTKIAEKQTSVNAAGTGSKITTTYYVYTSQTQTPGTYTGEVSYTMLHPYNKSLYTTLEEAFANAGKTKASVNGGEYYKMQDMSAEICAAAEVYNEVSQTQLVDTRDNKLYWVAKLDDGHCWMTENLDFDIPTTALSSTTTDLTSYDVGGYTAANGYSKDATTGEITWTPTRSTTTFSGTTVSGWTDNYYTPYSADPGNVYVSGNTNGEHGHVGNYYNWSAAVAANKTNISPWTSDTYSNIANNPQNSICPANWRLPTISNASETVAGSTNEFKRLNYLYNENKTNTDAKLLASPLYLVRSGYVASTSLFSSGTYGYYWSSSVDSSTNAYYLYFNSSNVGPAGNSGRRNGFSVRCVAR